MRDTKPRRPATRRRSRAKKKAIQACRNVYKLPEYERLWLHYRASEFELVDGVEVPVYSYRKIARNFATSRRWRLTKWVLRRFILRVDPDLSKRRGDPYAGPVKRRKAAAEAEPFGV